MGKDVKKMQLPDVITLDDEYRKCHAAWMAVLGNAQRAFDDLLSDKDVGDILPSFDELSAQWVSDFVRDKIEAVMTSPSPYNTRMKTVAEWRNLEKDLIKKVKKVKDVCNLDPQVKVEVMGCHIVISNLDEILKERAKFVVPQEYKCYYEKIVGAYNAVKELMMYEKENNLPHFPTDEHFKFIEPNNFIAWRLMNKEIGRYKYTGCMRHG